MNHDILERRYRALLRAYPADYRRERTDELLEILISEAPATRRWPEPRQAIALVRAGLRVRSGSAARRPTAVLFWQGLHLAAMAVLALGTVIGLDDTIERFQFGGLDDPLNALLDNGLNLIMTAAALAALALGRSRPAAVLVVAAIAVPTAASQYLFANSMPQWWAPVVAAPLVLAGLRRPADVPAVGRGNGLLATLAVVALHLVPVDRLTILDPVQQGLVAVVTVGAFAAFLWVATADQRLLLAAAPTFAVGWLHQVTLYPESAMSLYRAEALPSLIVAVAMVLGAVAMNRRRQAQA
ncbi:hypothetical protein AB0J80_35605 [Actinoplanes sp. NPDC049548]|uniref:hypothetical protein n=1 Tax=Actinoplanes sp. NPDC049548 TaxID=3155152 RepID=UPI00343BAD92